MAADPDVQRRQHAERVRRYRERLKAGLVGARLLTDPNDEGTPPHCYESLPEAPPHGYESTPEQVMGVPGADAAAAKPSGADHAEYMRAYRAGNPERTRQKAREYMRAYRARKATTESIV